MRKGSPVIVRTHYYPAWSARSGDVAAPLYASSGQLAFDAPAHGSYDAFLDYPTSLVAAGPLAGRSFFAGAGLLRRRPVTVSA